MGEEGVEGHRVTWVDPEQKNEDQLLRSRKEVKENSCDAGHARVKGYDRTNSLAG